MGGQPIGQAKSALLLFLKSLPAENVLFNIIGLLHSARHGWNTGVVDLTPPDFRFRFRTAGLVSHFHALWPREPRQSPGARPFHEGRPGRHGDPWVRLFIPISCVASLKVCHVDHQTTCEDLQ